jgi:hypothetical protein
MAVRIVAGGTVEKNIVMLRNGSKAPLYVGGSIGLVLLLLAMSRGRVA